MVSGDDRSLHDGHGFHTPKQARAYFAAPLSFSRSQWDGQTTRPISSHSDLQNFESSSSCSAFIHITFPAHRSGKYLAQNSKFEHKSSLSTLIRSYVRVKAIYLFE
jgi:hypothetical protein